MYWLGRTSFRLRLALSVALLAGVALTVFAAIAWWQMYRAKVSALDHEFLEQAERELFRRWPAEHWPIHELNLSRTFGAQNVQQILLLVLDRDGVVYQSRHWPTGLSQLPWPQLDNYTDALVLSTVELSIGRRQWRFGLAVVPEENLAIGVDLTVVNEKLVELRNAFLLAAPLALGFIGFGAWLISGRALAPIQRLTATIVNITAKGLDQRIPLSNADQEIHQLIEVFNRMLERLERSFQQASRFSADAAHGLKTPLAILQGQIEQAMLQCEIGSPMQARMSSILDEIQHLGMISRKLLLLALADAGRLRLRVINFDLSRALEELLEDAQMLAQGLDVSGVITPGLMIQADAELLKQALHNLLSNAIKYNLPNGWIRITAIRQSRDIVEVAIVNASADIPAADRKRIFERFYRADSAHNRKIEGVGLGLSLSREIARAHGGDLLLAKSSNGETRFVLCFGVKITNL